VAEAATAETPAPGGEIEMHAAPVATENPEDAAFVNPQITDSITQANTKVLGDSPLYRAKLCSGRIRRQERGGRRRKLELRQYQIHRRAQPQKRNPAGLRLFMK